jgi:hypothetical protein
LAANPYGTGKCKLSTDILLVPWVGWVSANELLEAGFNLVSAGSTVFTYQLGGWYPDIDADAPNQLYSGGIRNLWSSDASIQTTPVLALAGWTGRWE